MQLSNADATVKRIITDYLAQMAVVNHLKILN